MPFNSFVSTVLDAPSFLLLRPAIPGATLSLCPTYESHVHTILYLLISIFPRRHLISVSHRIYASFDQVHVFLGSVW